jgi:epoxyqueuosine reductase
MKSFNQSFEREALNQGFQMIGFSRAEELSREARFLETWLKEKNHGEMHWMENHFDKRIDPRKLVPGTRSVVSLMLNYFPQESWDQEDIKISKYAWGRDYHKVIKQKAKRMIEALKAEIGDFEARIFVDSAPVMDRAWAERAGLGWVGKNANLINKNNGSFFFLAEILTDLQFDYNEQKVKDYCGTCRRCIDACPTQAIESDRKINASKCISYLTIELKNEIPESFSDQMNGWAFGCDVCQDVCPWNRNSKPHSEPEFQPGESLLDMTLNDWNNMTEELFFDTFKGTPVMRTKWKGFLRNMNFLTRNSKTEYPE